jgi:hypothetical protein
MGTRLLASASAVGSHGSRCCTGTKESEHAWLRNAVRVTAAAVAARFGAYPQPRKSLAKLPSEAPQSTVRILVTIGVG